MASMTCSTMTMVRPSARICSISAMPVRSSVGLRPGEPLVEQHNFGIGRERAGELDPLLIDIGERRDRGVVGAAQANPLQQVAGVVVEFAAPTPAVAEHAAGGDVLQHRQRRQHANDLKRAGNAAGRDLACRRSRNVLAVEQDRACSRLQRAGDHVQHRGLARAVRTDQSQHLVLRKLERHIVHGNETAEALGHALDAQRRGAGRRAQALSVFPR